MTALLVTAAVSYLLGSIPFGYILVRIFRGQDVRATGSGNIGATNVARSSPALGALTLFLDAGKGVVAVCLAHRLAMYIGQLPHRLDGQGMQPALQWVWPFASNLDSVAAFSVLGAIAALFAIIGHVFPVWLNFRGGKGVATALGSFVVIAPKSILCVIGVFALIFLLFRYVSLSSVVAVGCFPLMAWLWGEYGGKFRVLAMMGIASALVIWKHRANLMRLSEGTEPKFGRRA